MKILKMKPESLEKWLASNSSQVKYQLLSRVNQLVTETVNLLFDCDDKFKAAEHMRKIAELDTWSKMVQQMHSRDEIPQQFFPLPQGNPFIPQQQPVIHRKFQDPEPVKPFVLTSDDFVEG